MNNTEFDATCRRFLAQARDIVAHGWVQWAYAVDMDGTACEPGDPAADCHCALGALVAAGKSAGLDDERLLADNPPPEGDKPILLSVWYCAARKLAAAAIADMQLRDGWDGALPESQHMLTCANDASVTKLTHVLAWFDDAIDN